MRRESFDDVDIRLWSFCALYVLSSYDPTIPDRTEKTKVSGSSLQYTSKLWGEYKSASVSSCFDLYVVRGTISTAHPDTSDNTTDASIA